MPYVVTYKPPKGKEKSLDQILFGEMDESSSVKTRTYPGTVTRRYDSLPDGLYTADDIRRLINKLSDLPHMHCWYPKDMTSQYQIFAIPKRSGGVRTICAPRGRLYVDQVALRSLFQNDFAALYHTSAFAYCKGRSIKHCIQRHQANGSKWFLKLDFENFFGNTSKTFVLQQLEKIAPFSEVMRDAYGREILSKAIDICFFGGGLPQGTPISPMLTNLVMIPFDHAISNLLHKHGFVYTRYADDIQISHREKFSPGEIVNLVKIVLREQKMPYRIKNEKTRFGSSSGRNWNLGLMLNNENRITIGHEEHKRMKARIHSFVMDETHHNPWSHEDVQRLAGRLAYFESIEPYYAQHIIFSINKKLDVNFNRLLHKALKRNTQPAQQPSQDFWSILARAV